MIRVREQPLTADEFIELYRAVGWSAPAREQVALALTNSYHTVCVTDGDTPVGMGRVIGDGALAFFIQDVAIVPGYQRRGLGGLVLTSLHGYVRNSVCKGQSVCVELIASAGREPFYEKFGFGKKPGDGMGHGMMTLIVGEGG